MEGAFFCGTGYLEKQMAVKLAKLLLFFFRHFSCMVNQPAGRDSGLFSPVARKTYGVAYVSFSLPSIKQIMS